MTSKPSSSSRRRDKDDTTNPDVTLSSVGNYVFQKTVGEGNFAKVKLAKHKLTGAEVAVKVIDKTTLDEKKLGKLYREVRIMKMLHHPHIVKLYEVIETKHTVFLVMEYASGGELYDYLVVHGKMKEKEARSKFRQILSAVSYCHKKRVIHRDLKAENLLLDANLDIKIADFGFSNYYDPDGKLDTFCGSPPYAAPELFQGRRYTGPEVDIWSLGVILYVLTTGCLPFDGKNLQEMRESVCRGKYRIPFYLSDTCEKLLRKFLIRDPNKRSGLEMLIDDAWINDGYSDSPISSDQSLKPVEEDESIIRLMEAKYKIERGAILHALRENVYDDIAAIYYLLYFDKDNGNASSPTTAPGEEIVATKPSLTITAGPSMSSTAHEVQSATAALPTQAAPGSNIGKIEEDGDGSAPSADGVIRPRQQAAAKPRKRRFTVGGEADVQKLAAEDEEAADMLKKIQNQSTLAEEASSSGGVVPPSPLPLQRATDQVVEEEEEDGPPASLPTPAPVTVSPPVSADSPSAAGQAVAAASAAQQQQQQRKRHNTIVGILRQHMRRQSDANNLQPIAGTIQEQQSSLEGSGDVGSPVTRAESNFFHKATASTSSAAFGNDEANKPRSLRFTFNSNTTSSKPPDEIIAQIQSVCQAHSIHHKLNSRFLVECYWVPPAPGAEPGSPTSPGSTAAATGAPAISSGVKFEIEVCKLPRLKNLHGLRFKRVGGSSSDYKDICEKVLASLEL